MLGHHNWSKIWEAPDWETGKPGENCAASRSASLTAGRRRWLKRMVGEKSPLHSLTGGPILNECNRLFRTVTTKTASYQSVQVGDKP
jgi:hypothetical protein